MIFLYYVIVFVIYAKVGMQQIQDKVWIWHQILVIWIWIWISSLDLDLVLDL
jgi:hypothetical protein